MGGTGNSMLGGGCCFVVVVTSSFSPLLRIDFVTLSYLATNRFHDVE